MKTIRQLLAVCLTLIIGFGFKNTENIDSKRILTISFVDQNFKSDSYYSEEIGKVNNVTGDEVLSYIDSSICNTFTSFDSKTGFRFENCPKTETTTKFVNKISINESQCKLNQTCYRSDINAISTDGLSSFMQECNMDYLMIINGYSMNYIGKPYYMVNHTISYDIYTNKGQIVNNSIINFNTSKLVSFDKIKGKISKEASKISKQLSK